MIEKIFREEGFVFKKENLKINRIRMLLIDIWTIKRIKYIRNNLF